jgi:hypothetical protein
VFPFTRSTTGPELSKKPGVSQRKRFSSSVTYIFSSSAANIVWIID